MGFGLNILLVRQILQISLIVKVIAQKRSKDEQYYQIIRECQFSLPVIKYPSSYHPAQENDHVAYDGARREQRYYKAHYHQCEKEELSPAPEEKFAHLIHQPTLCSRKICST